MDKWYCLKCKKNVCGCSNKCPKCKTEKPNKKADIQKEVKSSIHAVAEAIRGLSDEEIIYIYNLGITQLETIALQLKAKINKNLMSIKRES